MTGTCIVTGGAGFIGCALSPHLLSRFDRVVALDCLHPQVHAQVNAKPGRPAALPPEVELVQDDVADPDAWDRLLGRVVPQTVIHLAAETGTGQSLTEATRHARTNVVGTAVMLDALARHDRVPARIVLSSSRAVYGEGAWRDGAGGVVYPGQRSAAQLGRGEWDFPGLVSLPASSATSVPAPVSVYGATKLTQEHMLGAWASSFGTAATVLRLQNVYGPGQSLTNPYTGIVSLFCRLAAAGRSIPLYEDGAMLRDFVLIDDVARAFTAVLDHAGAPGQPIDIGTGISVSIATLAQEIARHYGAPDPHVCGKFRFGDVRHAACDTGPTFLALPWRPQADVAQGVARLAAWIGTQPSAPPA